MPKSKTPSYFEVGPHKVKITFKEYLADDHRGLSDFANGTVAVEKPKGATDTYVDQTLWHEITHWILEVMGEEKLNRDEKFVDLFGSLICQVLRTLK